MTLQLFDFIAQCVSQFLAETIQSDPSKSEERLPLGFVFPFTCRQTQLDKVRGRALSQAVTTAQLQRGEEPSWCQSSMALPHALHRQNSSPGPRASTAMTWWGRMWYSCCSQPSTSRRWGPMGLDWLMGKQPLVAIGCPLGGAGNPLKLLLASSPTWMLLP